MVQQTFWMNVSIWQSGRWLDIKVIIFIIIAVLAVSWRKDDERH
jgi:uncharacterized membrane protein